MDRRRLSKTIALALRHKPWLFEIELDSEGWTPTSALLTSLQAARPEWRALTVDDIAGLIADSEKPRYEIDDDRIRAMYGHSVAARINKAPAVPPEILYHGTHAGVVPVILAEGLKPMSRQYVHFSVDREMAQQVGRRKGAEVVILTVLARQAHDQKIVFYQGNEIVWLADTLPPEFLRLPGGD